MKESNTRLSKNELGLVETIKGTETINLNENPEKKLIVKYSFFIFLIKVTQGSHFQSKGLARKENK